MTKFRVGYSQSDHGWYYFEADDIEHARKLFNKVTEGEMEIEELPGVYQRITGGDHEWLSSVEVA